MTAVQPLYSLHNVCAVLLKVQGIAASQKRAHNANAPSQWHQNGGSYVTLWFMAFGKFLSVQAICVSFCVHCIA